MSAAEPLTVDLPAGITLHVYGRTRGWLARVYRDGSIARKLFSWGVHGGSDAALGAAVAWLTDEQAARSERARKRAPGYGYVRRTERSYRDASGELRRYDAFEAWVWGLDGRPNQTSYGVRVHGESGAEALCRQWLERQRRALGLSSE
jgi:hypothetical protein